MSAGSGCEAGAQVESKSAPKRVANVGEQLRRVLRSLPPSQVYRLVEPGPVVPPTTAGNDVANVMTMSWRMTIEFEAPLIACVVSSGDYSFGASTTLANA